MTKFDILKKMGIETETYADALPQDWFDQVSQIARENILPHFVWLYDEKARLLGRPCSLSLRGDEILSSLPNGLFCGGRFSNEEGGEINE